MTAAHDSKETVKLDESFSRFRDFSLGGNLLVNKSNHAPHDRKLGAHDYSKSELYCFPVPLKRELMIAREQNNSVFLSYLRDSEPLIEFGGLDNPFLS